MEYEQLERRFGAVMSRSVTGKNVDWDQMKKGFVGLVDLLHQAHREGVVESVEGIPSPEEVSGLDKPTFQRLYLDVVERYFPNDVGPREDFIMKYDPI